MLMMPCYVCYLSRTFDEELRCYYRRNRERSGVAAASSATRTWRSPAGRSVSRRTSGTRARPRRRPYLRQPCTASAERAVDMSTSRPVAQWPASTCRLMSCSQCKPPDEEHLYRKCCAEQPT